MENICFTVIIRQQMCQSGVPVTRENVYSNISQNSTINLLNGYTLNLSISAGDTTSLQFINGALGINLAFNIQNQNVALFDLPVDNTIFRVSIFVQKNCCATSNCPNRR